MENANSKVLILPLCHNRLISGGDTVKVGICNPPSVTHMWTESLNCCVKAKEGARGAFKKWSVAHAAAHFLALGLE